MGCLGECWDVGPPPDSILTLPPPPAPAFLQNPFVDVLLNTTPCSSAQLCESIISSNRVPDSGDYVELPRKDIETWSMSGIDDTWLLVLVASSIGVLLLGALLAMFLLKCREMSMFETNDCTNHSNNHRQIKNHESRECTSVSNTINGNKLVHPSETVLYHGNGPTTNNFQDNRMVWAALTPHGTQHFVSENYPRDLIDYNNIENDDHYETVENLNIEPAQYPNYNNYQQQQQHQQQHNHHKGLTLRVARDKTTKTSFDNSGFVDYYDYEDPTPLIESYQLNDMENRGNSGGNGDSFHYLGNTDMRCAASFGYNNASLRRGITTRPRVSSPTRIEHPNLPPLNLYPHKNNTLKRNTINYRNIDSGTLPKYGC